MILFQLVNFVIPVLANRLKVVLPHIISHNQSALLPGRLIMNNILTTYETLHTMHARMWGKVVDIAIKLDMSQAYDSMEWGFMDGVMRKMGFNNRWVNLIIACVRTVTYYVFIIGKPSGCIVPSRGIRQGDHLSPNLFIVSAKALSSLFCHIEATRVPTSKIRPRINHLFLDDDSLFFCKVNLLHWRKLNQLLDLYEWASGQKLNKAKTLISLVETQARRLGNNF